MSISDTVKTILKNRGVSSSTEIERFLNPRYEDSHDPFLLNDMEKAISRIVDAIDTSESIVIYGDYDIDGLSATTLLLDALGSAGAQVSAYIPDRFEEGYGINTEALKKLKKQGADLVVTVDCGSSSHEPLTWAVENSLDVIVTDHHTVKATLPPAVAVINPKRDDNTYPFTDLAGVGVAFKLAQALVEKGYIARGQEKWLLDLVALGTVCDVVSLTDENRIFVYYGLQVFAKTRRVGMQALMEVAGVDKNTIDTDHFGFALGPRLNAAGRIEHARLALELFTATDQAHARELARNLDGLNRQRREEQDRIYAMACEQAETYDKDKVLVLSDSSWSHGIVGIVAAKIMERFGKPTIVLQELGDEAKGSARSMGDFSIVRAMDWSREVLTTYGGHHVAAGCKLKTTHIDRFRGFVNEYFDMGEYGDLRAEPVADIAVEELSHLNRDLLYDLERLAPFGMGNPRPLFAYEDIDISRYKLVGKEKTHVKVELADASGTLDGIGFNLASEFTRKKAKAQVWFELDENEYMGRNSLQAKIKAVK